MANDGEKNLQAAYEQLIEDSITVQFEKNGTIAKLQSELHVKVLQMLKGQLELNSNEILSGGYGDASICAANEGLMGLLNQLIVEYFDWFGFKHTMETFKMESGVTKTSRKELLGQFDYKFNLKELPVLMQMIMQEQKKEKIKDFKVKQLPSMKQPPAKEEQSLIPHLTNNSFIKQKKVTQKTIKNPLAKTSVVKQMKPLLMTETKPKNPSSIPLHKDNLKSSSDIDSSDTDYNSSCEDDPFFDIPNRYYYREMDPPERTYPIGVGEEGPYKTKQKRAEILFQKYKQQVTPTSKNLTEKKCNVKQLAKSEQSESCHTVMTGREALEIQLNRAIKAKAKSLNQTTIRTRNNGKNLWAKQRSPPSEIEPDLAVMKPRCPDTLISNIQLESDDSYA